MVVRTLSIGLFALALAAAPAAATPEPPLPPGNLSWTWVTSPADGWWVSLTWDTPDVTPDHYLLFRLGPDGAGEPVEIAGDATGHVDEASSRAVAYAYFLVAVDDGVWSPPSDPAIAGDDFQCETFGWSIRPPAYTFRPECLPP